MNCRKSGPARQKIRADRVCKCMHAHPPGGSGREAGGEKAGRDGGREGTAGTRFAGPGRPPGMKTGPVRADEKPGGAMVGGDGVEPPTYSV